MTTSKSRTVTAHGIFNSITNLLKAGISIVEIENLTGAKSDLIRGCMPSGLEDDLEKENRFLNMRLTSSEHYYKL